MSASEYVLLVGVITTSLISIIGAVFAGLATMRTGANGRDIATVQSAIDDPTTGLKPLHDLSNSNFVAMGVERDKERATREGLTTEVSRLNEAAAVLAAAALQTANMREAAGPSQVEVVNSTPIDVAVKKEPE